MAPDETIEVTAQDVESLDRKLTAFAETLPPGEEALFLDLVERATSGDEDDVQGYSLMPLTPGLTQIAKAARKPARTRCRGRHGHH
ncbi:MAG: hypothetical protein HYU88_03985 [Chloroflexi bacterium]|nr:hypothetical protein [Chloroflexota bacterium]